MVLESIWKEFLSIVQQEAGSRVVETWLKAVVLYQWDDKKHIVYLQAPNKFVKDWIESNYLDLVQLHLRRLFNVEQLSINILDCYPPQEVTILPAVSQHEDNFHSRKVNEQHVAIIKRVANKKITHTNEFYGFDSFIVGPHNSLAHAAALAVTKHPGELYNPLFIYGGSGLGKTHLLHAIGNELKIVHQKLAVLYQPADRFVNEFISAIRSDKMHLFQERYKDIDILLIDDIQFMANKEQTQEAFFHIFNFLYESGKQVVFSSDTYPADINGMAKRLKSRFESGLVTDIRKPLLETKIAILKKKAELHHEELPDDVAHYIAASVENSIRELEGAFIRVIAFSHLTNQSLSLELVQKVLLRLPKKTSEEQLSLSYIAKYVAQKYTYTLDELRSSKKNKDLSLARQVAMYLMKLMTDKSLREIGLFLDRKDHTTVVHALKKIEYLRETDTRFSQLLHQLKEEIDMH